MLSRIRLYWKKIGPGVITGISDDDPSGIATYSLAGAALGLKLLWTALLTYPLMFGIQAMSARIGIVSSSGLIGVIRKHYPSYFAWIVMLFVIPAIIINIAADLASMVAILNIGMPKLSKTFLEMLLIVITMGYMFLCRYKTVSIIFKICCVTLLGYFIVPFLVSENWSEIAFASFIPHFEWTHEYVYLFVAILGTTISPYLFFWQSSLSHEEKQMDTSSKPAAIKWMKLDVNLGMLISNLAMYFIILASATTLHSNGITDIKTVEDAAMALKPLAGEFAFLAFSLGVLGVGFLAIPVLSGCIGYMVSEYFHWENGLDKLPKEAPKYYAVIAASLICALLINFIGIDPIDALVFTAVLYSLITPPVLIIILLICNNKKIMGNYVNTPLYNVLGGLTLILMTFAAGCLAYFQFE